MFEQVTVDRNRTCVVRLFRIVALLTALGGPLSLVMGNVAIGVWALAQAAAFWYTGNRLDDRKVWARRAAYVLSGVQMLAFPLGTVIGAICIVSLALATRAGAFLPDGEVQPDEISRRPVAGLVTAVGVVVVLGVLGAIAATSNTAPLLTEEEVVMARRTIAGAEESGLIERWTCATHEAHLDAAAWQTMPLEQQRLLGTMLAGLCEVEDAIPSMTVFDSGSGRRMAEVEGTSFEVF